MTLYDSINELVSKENSANLDSFRISGIPVWNVLKYDIRRQYLNSIGIKVISEKTQKFNVQRSLFGIFQSIIHFHKLLFFPYKVDNLIMGFSRLDNIDGYYLDRFIDPIIDMTLLKESYIYIEYGKRGMHLKPRKNCHRCYYLDYSYMLSFLWSYISGYLFLLLHYDDICVFQKRIMGITGLPIKKKYLSRKIVEFKANVYFFSLIMNRVQAKRLFGVSKAIFKHAAFAAKKRHMKVYEFQHGVTLGETPLYSGNYVSEIDPDFFLLFGTLCHRNLFGVPESRTIVIGYAFKNYIKNVVTNVFKENYCLVISNPHITDNILDCVTLLAHNYPNVYFHIRRHPHEVFSDSQNKRISSFSNISDVTNDVNSLIVVMSYTNLIGENSTVLFEGLSLGKKVARLNVCGLQPVNRSDDDAFYYIDNVEDFGLYLNAPVKQLKENVYSDFNAELFNSFLE